MSACACLWREWRHALIHDVRRQVDLEQDGDSAQSGYQCNNASDVGRPSVVFVHQASKRHRGSTWRHRRVSTSFLTRFLHWWCFFTCACCFVLFMLFPSLWTLPWQQAFVEPVLYHAQFRHQRHYVDHVGRACVIQRFWHSQECHRPAPGHQRVRSVYVQTAVTAQYSLSSQTLSI